MSRTRGWYPLRIARFCAACYLVLTADLAAADRRPVLTVPDGFSIELVAGPPLVERPITAAFDDEGRLYVAESSGSNDPVEKQLAERPHRIVRLEDTDGDGKFDKRVVFADRMMFPEGTMYLDGSLYVSAPPSIWKLTDTNGDGLADERIEWFQGKTLTGCANDLHGPYLGPDGWVYWCKGAFAEQTHVVNGREWKSRAAHIFRCRPDGTELEPMMTGGMDNPVDIVFMPNGERLFTATYLQASGARRDGVAHAVYGGVFGKPHSVLDGHARTGELMPAVALMTPTAPCGMERYDSDVFGPDYRDNLFVCQFNMRTVSRHVLRESGSSYASEDFDFVTSEDVDFHPTDVLVDADGSLLVVDTGGWYKLCCPTSQLWKPDVLGGIYRVRRDGATPPTDPRGNRIDWDDLALDELWEMMCDARPAVRQRASRKFVRQGESQAMNEWLAGWAEKGASVALLAPGPPQRFGASACDPQTAALARAWALFQVKGEVARALSRQLLTHDDDQVRHVALQMTSLNRDTAVIAQVIDIFGHDTAANRRAAAEALGRIGDPSAVPHLLAAAAKADDRALEHSIIYALIELAQPETTRSGLNSGDPNVLCAALVALDQMPGGKLQPAYVIELMNWNNEDIRRTARWIVERHPEWGDDLTDWFRQRLAGIPTRSQSYVPPPDAAALEELLVRFARNESIQQLLAETVLADGRRQSQEIALRVMAKANLPEAPLAWRSALAKLIERADRELLLLAVAAARATQSPKASDALHAVLVSVANSTANPRELRVLALAAASSGLAELEHNQFALLLDCLATDQPVSMRSAAVTALEQAQITPAQLERMCEVIKSAGPLELNRLLAPFARGADSKTGTKLVRSLKEASALASLRVDLVRDALKGYGPEVQRAVDDLERIVNVDAAAQRKRIEELLPLMTGGDVRRGHAVYYNSKAACSACHRLGNAGGEVGPELSHIGEIRTERDLLESILYPNLSIVRSFESVLIIKTDGRTVVGRIRDESPDELIVVTGIDQETRIARADVETIEPSTVSVMPAGLDKQLTTEQLADLVAFLKNAKGG